MGTPGSSSNTSRRCRAGRDALVWRPFHPRARGDALFYTSNANRLPPYSSYLRLSAAQINCADVATCTFYLFLFYGKVILAAVNLLSQITLLTLRISYVFSSLSSLNLPLSCPELSVASRVGRKEVLKVDVWGRNRANADVAHGSLPSASFSPQACGACQLPLVSNSLTKPTPTRPHRSPLWRSRCV